MDRTPMTDALEGRWTEWWARVHAQGGHRPAFADLTARYAEPHRHYHTLAHIAHVLAEFEEARPLAEHPDAVEAALWFHDAVYDPRTQDSEEQSVGIAVAVLERAGCSIRLIQLVADLIRMTRHESPPIGIDGQLLVDCDLAILGQPSDAFDRYEQRTRREFEWVSDEAFRVGRSIIVQRFLNRPTVYATEHFRWKYEAQAQENLARACERWKPHR